MADFITRLLRFTCANGTYHDFKNGQVYEIKYRRGPDGVHLLLGEADPDESTLLVTEQEFIKCWVTP